MTEKHDVRTAADTAQIVMARKRWQTPTLILAESDAISAKVSSHLEATFDYSTVQGIVS